ncbi:purine and uridine phosphorylase [Aspergillus minisclerotigenes]|uniref:Purine and uridine phosphorylase n=1 Tax=Aspergillus minisclerotigenes TaxID=656917 RepID=A0A5N6J3K7_9EURO|nr:purine and uridine phosphorylase [Aspergillus minisclerotigenes]
MTTSIRFDSFPSSRYMHTHRERDDYRFYNAPQLWCSLSSQNMAYSHDEYTIAWRCALPREVAVAKAVLDGTYTSLPQPKSDRNVHTLRTINGHYIVVASLLSGAYRAISAATLLGYVQPTFPSLQFAFMVGWVLEGVASQSTDIQLDNTVVSIPAATSGGVIQYDYGKTFYNGCRGLTGSVNKPPRVLLTAISQIRSDAILRNRPRWLFNSTYEHQSRSPDCSSCDQSQLLHGGSRITNEPSMSSGSVAGTNRH